MKNIFFLPFLPKKYRVTLVITINLYANPKYNTIIILRVEYQTVLYRDENRSSHEMSNLD